MVFVHHDFLGVTNLQKSFTVVYVQGSDVFVRKKMWKSTEKEVTTGKFEFSFRVELHHTFFFFPRVSHEYRQDKSITLTSYYPWGNYV